MPLIEADHPALSQRTVKVQSAFLTELEQDVTSIRNRVQDISQRLQDHGFYTQPEDASAATPVEGSTRGRIIDEMRALSGHLGRVEYQLTQLL